MTPTLLILAGMLLILTPWLSAEFDRVRDAVVLRRSLREAFKATSDDGMFVELLTEIDRVEEASK